MNEGLAEIYLEIQKCTKMPNCCFDVQVSVGFNKDVANEYYFLHFYTYYICTYSIRYAIDHAKKIYVYFKFQLGKNRFGRSEYFYLKFCMGLWTFCQLCAICQYICSILQ